jgi:hypothetical protein
MSRPAALNERVYTTAYCADIDFVDVTIDRLVYDLYGLTADEIAIVGSE